MPLKRRYTHPSAIQCTLTESDIPSEIARDAEVTSDISDHAGVSSAHHTKSTEIADVLTTHGDVLVRGATLSERLGHGVDGQFLKTQGAATNPVWDDVAAGGFPVKASDTLRQDNAAQKTTRSLTYVKLKEIKMKVALEGVRVKFSLKHQDANRTTYGKVYKNGVAIGIEQSVLGQTYVVKSEDFTGFAVDDLIQVYVKDEVNYMTSYVKDFQLCFDFDVASNQDP